MWELDFEESWATNNWCFWTVVLEKTLESPLDCKEIQPVHPKGDQSWVFIGRTDAEAQTPILWPPHAKSWLIGKDPDAGRDWWWGQEEKGTTEDEMAGWHHRLDGHEFEWTLGVCDGQAGLACCDSWGRKESDTTERLNWRAQEYSISNMTYWIMGRHNQSNLPLCNFKLSIGLEHMPICIPFHWLVVGTSPYFAQDITRRRKLEVWKGEAKRDWQEGWRGLLWECLTNKKKISAWADLSYNLSIVLHILFHCSKFLLGWDKNWQREIKHPDIYLNHQTSYLQRAQNISISLQLGKII